MEADMDAADMRVTLTSVISGANIESFAQPAADARDWKMPIAPAAVLPLGCWSAVTGE
jgi:hypothetical protein